MMNKNGKYTLQEKDGALCRVAESKNEELDIDLIKDDSADLIKHLINLGVLEKVSGGIRGFGNKQRIGLTIKGAEMYAKGGFKGERKREVIETIWKALDVIS